MTTRTLPALTLCLVALAALAADWPQWRGPNRDGVSKDTGLLAKWPQGGPALAWTNDALGLGYSAPAVVGDRVFVLGTRDKTEYVFCLGTKDGKEVWPPAKLGPVVAFPAGYGDGPRATPAVDGDHLYALGSQGDLVCVETRSGKEVWRKNLQTDLGGEINPVGGGLSEPKLGYGYSASPLVDGDRVVCVPGGKNGTLATLDKKTGNVLWRSAELTDQATYSPPVVAEVGGVRHYVQMLSTGVAGVAAREGKVLWNYKRMPRGYNNVVIPTPVVHDGHVFVTVPDWNFRAEGELIKLSADGGAIKAEKVYNKREMVNRSGGVVPVGGHLYGYSENKEAGEPQGLTCIDFKTGALKWADKGVERCSVTAADGKLFCFSEEDGTVTLAAASPEKFASLGSFKLPKASKQPRGQGKLWAHPVVANGCLYLRDQELLFCYAVK